MDKVYYIYITINLVNNKKYIGKHYGAIDDDYLGSGTLLKRAINKYGKENFCKHILSISSCEEENCEKEKYYMDLFNACFSDEFYNIHEGGIGGNTTKGYTKEQKQELSKKFSVLNSGSGNPMFGVKRPDDYKEKMSFFATHIRDNNVYRTEEFKNKISKVTSGKNNGMYGKKHTEKSKKKMSASHIGLAAGEKNGMYGKKGKNAINGKHIAALAENGQVYKVFNTKQEVLKFLSLKGHSGLNKAIKNSSLYKGYYWKELDKSVTTK